MSLFNIKTYRMIHRLPLQYFPYAEKTIREMAKDMYDGKTLDGLGIDDIFSEMFWYVGNIDDEPEDIPVAVCGVTDMGQLGGEYDGLVTIPLVLEVRKGYDGAGIGRYMLEQIQQRHEKDCEGYADGKRLEHKGMAVHPEHGTEGFYSACGFTPIGDGYMMYRDDSRIL